MEFHRTPGNRCVAPRKHVLVCEDTLCYQAQLGALLAAEFNSYGSGAEGYVQVTFVTGAIAAVAILEKLPVDLIVLDHDMPDGNGTDLLLYLKGAGLNVPVLTASGVESNNDAMMQCGATYKGNKGLVLTPGGAKYIRSLIGL